MQQCLQFCAAKVIKQGYKKKVQRIVLRKFLMIKITALSTATLKNSEVNMSLVTASVIKA